jgi:predicted Zn finger-like uncharacterized protein
MIILLLARTILPHLELLPEEEGQKSDAPKATFRGAPVCFDEYDRPHYVCEEEGPIPDFMVPQPLTEHIVQIVWAVDASETTLSPGRYALDSATLVVHHDHSEAAIIGPVMESVFALRQALRFNPGKIKAVERWDMGPAPAVSTETLPAAKIQASQDPTSSQVKFSCPGCTAKYTIDTGKIMGKEIRMKCKKCGNPFSIPKPAPAPAAPPPS